MKLVLGTVQLGLHYGIVNKTGQPTYAKALEILNTAIDNNICIFDTAQDYGESETILSNISSHKNIRIITKINFNRSTEINEINDKIQLSMKNLNIKSIDTLLLHTFTDFKNTHLINHLLEIKKNGLIKKLGVSVYNVQEAIEVLKNGQFELIQIPFNYLDNQWDNKEFHKRLTADVEIHVRSIFLQGILVNDFNYWPKIDNNLKYIYDNISMICIKYNLSKIELAISFVKSIDWITATIFGVDNMKQLNENIKLFNNTKKLTREQITEIKNLFENIPPKLTNPSIW